jgi:outer membrane usher protein
MLRPGLSRYSLTAGEFRDRDIDLTPWVTQGKYQRGVNNYLTAYTGFQLAEDYLHCRSRFCYTNRCNFSRRNSLTSRFQKQESQSGQSFRLSYSKLIAPTDTNLTLAAYRYSTENYYNLRDAI